MIELRHVERAFPQSTPLADVNAKIEEGDVIAVIGPSGCGKSTLLKMINLLDKPTSGQIIVDGVDITAPGYSEYEIRKKVGMVFQNFNLFGHLTVIENVMVPQMDILGKSKQEAYDRAIEILHAVGMDSRAMRYPDKLSGGQKQRVAIARTLAMDPEIILFDEPTSSLDPTMVGEVESVIRDLAKRGTTMMIVTHKMRFAREISNRVFYIDKGEIYEEGTPEQIFDNPQKILTRRFVKQLKSFETVIENREYDFIGIINEIEQYGQRVKMDNGQIYLIQSIFEELCLQILLEHNPDCKIHFVVEYSARENAIKTIVNYNGDIFDPNDTDNEISLAILKSQVNSIEYETIEEGEYRNQIVLQ